MDTFSSYKAATVWSTHGKHQTGNTNILSSLICSHSKDIDQNTNNGSGPLEQYDRLFWDNKSLKQHLT